MPNTPYEIIVAPFEVWLAPVGETFPDVDTAPAGNWKKLGTNGVVNIEESGVTVTHEQTIQRKATAGSMGTVKAVRSNENLTVQFTLWDLSVEQYAKVLNNAAIIDTAAGAGTPGIRSINLRQGLDVKYWAMLIKGTASAYGDGLNSQYQIPACFQSDNPAPGFNKADVAGLKCTFEVIEDLTAATEAARFGKFVMQDAVAT